ncbi:MAG: cytochrome P450 [Aestuariivirga sp.]|nr:cytochrome P450 [Aestuariivirga sp.]
MTDTKTLVQNFDFHGEALDSIFATYKELREKCPVGHSDKYGGFWFLTKSDDIFKVEQDPETYSVRPTMLVPPVADFPMIPIDTDPPELTEYRRILLPLFTPQSLAKMEGPVRDVARDLAKKFVESDSTDATAMFARALPTIFFSRLAGFPEKDWPKFDAWVDDILYERTKDPKRAKAAEKAVVDYFENLIAAYKGRTTQEANTGTIIDYLLEAKVNGKPLTKDELLSYCYLMFLGGLDTTAWAIRASLWYLAQDLKAQRYLREHPEAVPTAAEEFLRTMSPVQAMGRTCKVDTTIRGQKIKAGERVVLLFGAGNRDPEVYDNPEEIQIDRQDNKHLAFGAGHHRCLGSNLGRRELVIALEEFLKIVPEFTLGDLSEKWHGVGRLTLNIKK